uniref:Tudor domain-containing protein n=1 Tax=Steinernema glaseri TaxID=37863 RepID=A0A1I8AI82_9BILA
MEHVHLEFINGVIKTVEPWSSFTPCWGVERQFGLPSAKLSGRWDCHTRRMLENVTQCDMELLVDEQGRLHGWFSVMVDGRFVAKSIDEMKNMSFVHVAWLNVVKLTPRRDDIPDWATQSNAIDDNYIYFVRLFQRSMGVTNVLIELPWTEPGSFLSMISKAVPARVDFLQAEFCLDNVPPNLQLRVVLSGAPREF